MWDIHKLIEKLLRSSKGDGYHYIINIHVFEIHYTSN